MLRKPASKARFTPTKSKTKSYRADFIRRKLLQKAFNGNEKGYKTLSKLADTIHTGIEVLWRQKFMCDVELITPDRKHLHAHKLVLATCCDYFYDIFVDESSADAPYQLEVEDVSGNILEVILESMYTGKVKIEANNVDDLLSAADTFGMFFIMDACEDFLLEHVNRDNCLKLMDTAFKYNLNRLTYSSLEIAATNFQIISKRQLFRRLPAEHIIPMLKRNDLQVNSELEVFQRMCSWIEEDKQSRLKHAADILATIRLPLLTPSEIVDNVECCSAIMDVPECQTLVKEALHYHLMPARQSLLQSPRTVPRRKADLCLVVVGGAPRLKNDNVCDDVMMFNHGSISWEHVTKLPEPRHHHAVAVLHGFLYVAGGDFSMESCAPTNHVHRYNPRDSNWMKVANMCNSRQSFQTGVLNGAIYAVGGRVTAEESLSSVERYDPSLDRWEEVASLSSPRRCVAVSNMGGRIYAVGGSGSKVISSRVERYTPSENRWEILKPINTPRVFAHLLHVGNDLYLVGGATIDPGGQIICVDTVERYSIAANQWTVVTKMRTPRSESGCTVVKEKVYILGGYNWNASERLSDVECFDTDTNSWSVLPNIKQPLTGAAAAGITLYEDRKSDITDINSNNDAVGYTKKGNI